MSAATAAAPTSVAWTFAVALAGGSLCRAVNAPLPWLLGSLLAVALVNVNGAGLRCPAPWRMAGQAIVGIALGMYFTAPVMLLLLGHATLIVLSTVWSIVLGCAFACALVRWAGSDWPTAFFAGAAGGAAEMVIQGERAGGRADLIAAAHSVRVLLIVLSVPLAFRWLDLHGSDPYGMGSQVVDASALATIGLVACLAGSVLAKCRVPNGWLIGPLGVAVVLGVVGLTRTSMPAPFTALGQLLIGAALGSRFAPDFFLRAPRFLAVMGAATLAGIAVSALVGWMLAEAYGMPPPTIILATAPGGLVEMALTAKALALGVPVITAFHVVRMFALVISAGWICRKLGRHIG